MRTLDLPNPCKLLISVTAPDSFKLVLSLPLPPSLSMPLALAHICSMIEYLELVPSLVCLPMECFELVD